MQIEILTPEKKIFDGEAKSIRLPGVEGSFQLLNQHAPIVAALVNGKVSIETDKGVQDLHITGGFVECKNSKVAVLIEGLEE